MSRSAEDFINEARANSANQRANLFEGISNDDNSSDGGDEITWRDIQQTNASYDGSNAISGATFGTGYESNQGFNGAIGSSFKTERDEERGILNEYSSSNTVNEYDSGSDYPVRNYQPSSSEPVRTVPGSATRVIKKRGNMLEGMVSSIREKIPRSTSTKKSSLNTVAGVTRKFLTLQEITHNKPLLIRTVMWTSEHLDYGIEAITKGHQSVEIWSNIEYDDAEILVDAFLEAGQKSERWASAVRQVMDYEKRIKLGTILIPRAVKSIVHLFTYGIDVRIEA